jgi:hypothetical protein
MKHLKEVLIIVFIASVSAFATKSARAAVVTATTTNQVTVEEMSALASGMAQAIEADDFETAELKKAQLLSQGSTALPAIQEALRSEIPKVRMSLLELLSGMPGEVGAEELLKCAVNDLDSDVASVAAGMLEKRPIPRALSSNELGRAIMMLGSSDSTKAALWASLLARSRDAQPSDAQIRMTAIIDRFEIEILSGQSSPKNRGYLSPTAMRLNAFLIALPHIAPKDSLPIVQGRYSKVSDHAVKRKWFLFARGMCRDQSVIEELREFIVNSQEDMSERAVAVKAYAVAAGTNAIPFLESLIGNGEVGQVPGHPPSETGSRILTRPMQIVAKDELAGLKYPELRLKYRGY